MEVILTFNTKHTTIDIQVNGKNVGFFDKTLAVINAKERKATKEDTAFLKGILLCCQRILECVTK